MGQRENLLLFSVFIISLANIVGFLKLPLASIFTLLLILAIEYRGNLIIIFKTLPRDVKGIYKLVSTRRKLKGFEKCNWTEIDLFRAQVRKHPQKVCIYFEDQKWTFEDIEKHSNKVAHVFQQAGYRKGDVVALLMGNCPDYVCTWLGLGKIGVVTALINTNLRNASLMHCISAAQAKGIIYSDEFVPVMEEVSESVQNIDKYQYGDGKVSDALLAKDLKSLMKDSSDEAPVPDEKIGYRDKALYIYTSGTTGMPKPAIVAHHRVILMSMISYILDISVDDIVYNPLPLYHTAGGVLGVGGALCHGYTTVLRKKFSASSYWPDCIKYNCTMSQYIGEMCRYIQMIPPRPEDSAHKVKLLFGNGMRRNIMEVFQSRFKVERITELYGSTEGNTNLVNLDKKLGAIGFLPKIIPSSLLPMALIKVNEEGEPIRGEDGFCVRTDPDEPGMLVGLISTDDPTREYHGYLGSEKENQKKIIRDVFKKGDKAFLSGDLLIMDELGYMYFKDRTGDTFRWKGENVSTTEVEETIAAVIGLREVTVYGVEVGNLEGRAGMVAIVDPNGETNFQLLHSELTKRLPSYARPLFVRLTKEASITGTFKLKKSDLQKEGFNPSTVTDRILFNNGKEYVELTKDIYDQILDCKIRV